MTFEVDLMALHPAPISDLDRKFYRVKLVTPGPTCLFKPPANIGSEAYQLLNMNLQNSFGSPLAPLWLNLGPTEVQGLFSPPPWLQ